MGIKVMLACAKFDQVTKLFNLATAAHNLATAKFKKTIQNLNLAHFKFDFNSFIF